MVTTRKKITVVGAGQVGTTVAQLVAYKNLGNVVITDIVEGLPQGKALDLQQSGCLQVFDSIVTGTNDYKDTADSDIVVITAGLPRKPGQDRSDLLRINTKIVKQVTEQIMKHSSNPLVIVVSNPLDAMVYVAKQVSGLPKHRIMGMAGVLDSARFRTFVSLELNCSLVDVDAMVLGGHGDTMVPLIGQTIVGGKPIAQLIPAERLEQIVQRARDGGAEIVNYLKTGSAYYAPSASVVQMVESILFDKNEVLPCTAYLQGEYGANEVYAGVPVVLGQKGVERIVEFKLTEKEKALFEKSVASVRELISIMESS